MESQAEGQTEDQKKEKKPLSRLEGLQQLKSKPPEIPFLGAASFQPQALEMLGRLVKIMNDPILFDKFKQTIHKKFELTIHRMEKEIKGVKPMSAAAAGGGREESYFTQEECSFFSNSQEI
jgi:hypothetical protein